MPRSPKGKTPKERLIAARLALGKERALIGKYESAAVEYLRWKG